MTDVHQETTAAAQAAPTEKTQPAAGTGADAAAQAAVKPWQSKTLWASVIIAVVPLIPGVGPVVSGVFATNPELAAAVVGAVFGVLRLITKKEIGLK